MPTSFTPSQLEEQIAASVTGDLNETEQRELEVYLAEHPDAQSIYEESQAMSHLLEKTLKRDAPDHGFEDRMVTRFRRQTRQKSGAWNTFIAGLFNGPQRAWIAAVAVFVVAFLVGRTPEPQVLEGPALEKESAKEVKDKAVNIVSARDGHDVSGYADAVAAYITSTSDHAGVEVEHKEHMTQKRSALLSGEAIPGLLNEREENAALLRAASAAPTNVAETTKAEVVNSHFPGAEAQSSNTNSIQTVDTAAAAVETQRKLIRNAGITLEVVNYATVVHDLTQLARAEGGFVSTQNDRTQANGRSAGQMVIKLPPDQLDTFVGRLHEFGSIKSQAIKTDDVTKAYWDTEARLRNANLTEARLLELMEKKTDKVSDLLQVEKEIARVRESIEQMQGELKLWDSLAALATVTIDLYEKDLNQAADYLLKETATLSLFSSDVEKTFQEARSLAEKSEAQILSAQINRGGDDQISATVSLLASPDQSTILIEQIKALGRVNSYVINSERVAQDGQDAVETGTTRKDKVRIDLTLSDEESPAQVTHLDVQGNGVADRVDELKKLAQTLGVSIRSSSFLKGADGVELATMVFRLPEKDYPHFLEILKGSGKTSGITVERRDRVDESQIKLESDPVEIDFNLKSAPSEVSFHKGFIASIRNTLSRSFGLLMTALERVITGLAYLLPWLILGAVGLLGVKLLRRKK